MKIVFVSLHTSPTEVPGQKDSGGMNVVIAEQARSLSAEGHKVTIFTRATERTPAGCSPLDLNERQGAQVFAIEAGHPELKKEQLPEITDEFARKLVSIAEFREADVVHSHYWLSGVAAHKAKTILSAQEDSTSNSSYFITLHTVGAQKNMHTIAGNSREPEVRLSAERELTQTMHVIAVSHSELHAITESYGTPKQFSVVHPGVDTSLFKPLPHGYAALEESKDETPLNISVLGRIQPFKGQDLALAAFTKFVEAFPALAKNAQLTIAGTPTPGAETFYTSLRERAAKVGLAGKVIFKPALSRPEAARLLAASDTVLIPSHSETFGLVALEAAASGAVVIASTVAGLRESVRHDYSGFLVTDRLPLTWAKTIAALAADRSKLQTMKEQAIHFAQEHTWAAHAKKLLAVYAKKTPRGQTITG